MSIDVYKASAGSGKTFTLTQRYLNLLKKTQHRHILAVTFTNKATGEMKERIVETLSKIAAGKAKSAENTPKFNAADAQQRLATLLHDYSRFNVSTIDGFYQQIMRSFVRELGLYGGYTLVLDQSEVINKAIEDLILSLQSSEHRAVYEWLLNRGKEKIREGEDWKFQNELASLATQLFKEDVVASLAELKTNPNIPQCIVDFRKKLIEEQKSIVEGVYGKVEALKTILHKAGYNVDEDEKNSKIKQLWTKTKKNEWPEFTDPFIMSLQDADGVKKFFVKDYQKSHPDVMTKVEAMGCPEAMQQLYEFLTSNRQQYASISVMLKPLDLLPLLFDLDDIIQKYLTDNNMVMLSQVNRFLQEMISECDVPFIYEKMGNYLHHYMLDEFQDTSILQWKNFKPLIDESLGNGNANLVVGDIKQSIYRWRNSDWRILASIDDDFSSQFKVNHFPAIDPVTQKKEPTTNWRSYEDIVCFNNAFFAKLPQVFNDIPGASELLSAYDDVVQKVAPKHKDKQGLVQIKWANADDAKKKDAYAEWVQPELLLVIEQALRMGYDYKDIAVLSEKNDEGSLVASWLLEKNIPVISSESLLLSQSSVIRLLVAIIRLSCSSQPDVDAFIVRTLRAVSPDEETELKLAMQLPLFEAVECYIQLFKLNADDKNTAYLQAFQDLIANFVDTNYPDAKTFIDWWDRKGNTTKLPANDQLNAVQISTIHSSKGLAYPIVIMPFCANSIHPSGGGNQTLLWCSTAGTPFTDLPIVPVEYGKLLSDSYFSKAYHEEFLYKTIDFVNKWYVAFTRPEHALFIFSKKSKKEGTSQEGSVLYQVAKQVTEDLAVEREVEWAEQDVATVLTIGSMPSKPSKQDEDSKDEEQKSAAVAIPYYSKKYKNNRLNLRLKSQNSEAQRDGNILHQLLQFIQTPNDLEKAIAKTVRMGMLLSDRIPWARKEMEYLLVKSPAKIWFDGSYESIWNERSIMTPANQRRHHNAIYRPDRLLVKDDTITVVDYKFGDPHDSYQRQIKNYMHLLKDMGKWKKIEGYLYYHKTATVTSVSI